MWIRGFRPLAAPGQESLVSPVEIPALALPAAVEVGVVLACIGMAGAVVIVGLARRREGFDPMLVLSAAAVVALALVILLTR